MLNLQPTRITKDDVWGKWSDDHTTKIHDGMVLADCRHGGFDEDDLHSVSPCPVFGDPIPWKSVTVVCDPADESDVVYWLHFVHGSDCISKSKVLPTGEIALRSDYQCW